MVEPNGEPGQVGTVTVLLAEVGGAEPLRERGDDEGLLPRMALYEARLRNEVEAHGGVEEGAVGEGFMFALPGARAALRCAVAVQRGLSAEESAALRVRMAVHSGEAERGDGELRGRVVLKAARIAALARGGEILASALAWELADMEETHGDIWRDEPKEVELRGLRGRHSVVPVRWERQAHRPERIVIADDAAIVRDGVAALLRENGLEVVATASDAEGLLDAVASHQPDVALIDIRMPPTQTNEGLIAAELIRRSHPNVGVLVLSQHVEISYALRLMRDGEERSGYLLKDRIAEVDTLLGAIRRVARGGCVVDPALADLLVRRADARGSLADLTEREREVLGLLAQGLSNTAIAEQLVVTGRTVETHVGQIFLKLGLREQGPEHRRVAAVLTYLRASEQG